MESSLGRLALIKIEECFTKSGKKNFFEFAAKELKPLIKDKPGLSVVFLELETHQEIIRGNIDKAMKNLDQIINKYNLDEYTDKYTLFRIGSFYIHFYSDVEKAEKIFNQIISKYPNDPLIEEISFLMNMPVYKGQIASNTIIEITDKVKEEYRIENYPNPFNPTTTIQYQIPQDGHISIKIYDMLGREVAQLVNENKKAGEYTISFDASRLASGIYIYKLVGNNVNISKKMILMK
jgi:tetratricopeptide (TPR) repeat protein